MHLPSPQKCFELIRRMDMLEHIVMHSVRVCQVASCIAENLNDQLRPLNPKLILAASLLHDITKTQSFKTGEHHAKTGAELIKSYGYPEVADIIRQHVRLDVQPVDADPVGAAQIVNYADKRVLHDRVVPLSERKVYIFKKYGRTPEDRSRLNLLWRETEILETLIFHHLPFSPDEITDYIKDGSIPPGPAG